MCCNYCKKSGHVKEQVNSSSKEVIKDGIDRLKSLLDSIAKSSGTCSFAQSVRKGIRKCTQKSFFLTLCHLKSFLTHSNTIAMYQFEKLSLAANLDWNLHQFDIKMFYLCPVFFDINKYSKQDCIYTIHLISKSAHNEDSKKIKLLFYFPRPCPPF